MRGMFESTEVTIPTSFVILPVDMTTIANGDTNLDGIVRFMCEKSIELGTTFARAIHGTSFFVPQGEPLFLYLVDEIEGTPVVPTSSDQAYPIRIDTQSPQFLAVAMPYLQTGLKLLKSVNTVAQLAKFVGVSAGPFVEKAIQLVERAQTKSSVDGFEVVRSAIQTSIDVPIPVQRIRGAALRELKRFFNEMDPLETFSGLRRTYTANGHVIWTSAENAKKIEDGKPRPRAIAPQSEQASRIIKIYQELLAQQNVLEDTSEQGNLMMLDGGISLQNIDVKEFSEQTCTCEMMY
ncbi:Aste57867_7401 [Aphanomyces stellatus]|uniref:Aste57867_7401 protein n=2 Tax=Aphanomyces stellatus TaxID=120398 RepID=A0A485KIA8_9STRA|nr:hypothetical protein As57867_007375 [Aphanomyces stellatus]VFT84316.1 Aste57867_7401 [Aphanomyces stellatus]